jgi:hypothetical protein
MNATAERRSPFSHPCRPHTMLFHSKTICENELADEVKQERKMKIALITAAALIALAPTAFAADVDDEAPLRKPGLWVTSTVAPGAPIQPPTTKLCTDDATEATWKKQRTALMAKAPPPDPACKKSVQRDGNTVTSDESCGKDSHHSTYTVADDHVISMEIHAKVTSPVNPAPADIIMKSDWVGECPAPLVPGDMQTPAQPQLGMPATTINTITGQWKGADGKQLPPAR